MITRDDLDKMGWVYDRERWGEDATGPAVTEGEYVVAMIDHHSHGKVGPLLAASPELALACTEALEMISSASFYHAAGKRVEEMLRKALALAEVELP